MIYIPVKIKEFIKDENDKKFVICDAIVNTIPLTEFRNIKKVQLDLIRVERSSFNYKSIRKGQTYTLILKNHNYETCLDKKINGWGDYVFTKYEKYINKEYNKEIKRKKPKRYKKYKKSIFWSWDFNFDLGISDIKI